MSTRPYTVFYSQDQELGVSFDYTFTLPSGNRFIIEYVNLSCQSCWKDRYIKLLLRSESGTLPSVLYNFVFDPVLQNNFPYGIYRINQLVKIAAERELNVHMEIVNPQPDDGIGDLLVTLNGYVTDSY